MMNYQRHLSLKKISLIILVIFLFACEEEKKENYDAKVEDSLLTNEEILNLQKLDRNKRFVKGELTRNWIESEVIKKEAEAKGVFENKKFKELMETQKIKFAESILFDEYYKENYSDPTPFALQTFYDNSKENFILQDDGFVINVISFSNESEAIKFRNYLITSDWERGLNKFKNSAYIKASATSKFFLENGIYNLELLSLLKQMEDGEVSIIIKEEPSDYKVVQLVKYFEKFSLPEFNYIKSFVLERYKVTRSQELYREYLNKLYDKYNVEIGTEK